MGGSAKIEVDTRLICAALRPLEGEVQAGRFRADLFYRIQGITLEVPALRERPADIAPLVDQLTTQLRQKHGTDAPKIGRRVMGLLRSHSWPGNVRELKNVVELLVLLRAGKKVRVSDLPAALRGEIEPVASGPRRTTLEVDLGRPLAQTLNEIIAAALALEGGNRTRAAERLGVSLRTLQRRVAGMSGVPPEPAPAVVSRARSIRTASREAAALRR